MKRVCEMHPELDGDRDAKGRCRACHREKQKAYYQANKERISAERRAEYAADPSAILERNREYARRNAEEARKRANAYYWTNREDVLRREKERRAANPEKSKEQSRDYYSRHAEAIKSQVAKWRSENMDKARAYNRAYASRNPDAMAVKASLRRARKMQAAPIWLDDVHMNQMRRLYLEAALAGMTVDHIVPIAGCRECGAHGLHVPWNMQLLDGPANFSKRDRCGDCWSAAA